LSAAATHLDWLYHLLGYTFAAAAVVLLLWALFWDRSRGRRRCPKCWYDMAGVPGLRCPECGREARREGSLHRTRRRWRGVCIALVVMLAASPVWSVPRIRRDGWFGAVPTTILALAAPMGGSQWEVAYTPDWRVLKPPHGSCLDLTLERLNSERAWSWQSQLFYDRLFRANPGEILNMLGVPKKWPAGVPLRLRLNPGYPGYRSDETTVRVRLKDGAAWTERSASYINASLPDPGILGLPSAGADATILDVELRDARGRLWRGVVRPPMRVEGTMQDYMKGVQVPGIGEALAGTRPRIVFATEGRAYFSMDNQFHGLRCTLAVDVELMRDGILVGRTTIFRLNLSAAGFSSGPWQDVLSGQIQWRDANSSFSVDGARWEARLTPNESLAMQNYVADTKGRASSSGVNTYWTGEVTIPVKVQRFIPTDDPYEFK
jgi:hypothetical protein